MSPRSSQTEIGYHDNARPVNKDVGGLDIAMNNIILCEDSAESDNIFVVAHRMDVRHSLEDLLHQ